MTAITQTLPPSAVPASHSFASRRHPGDLPAALVYARAVTPPLTFAMVLVMIAAGAAMLLGNDPLGWVIWAVPSAIFLAAAFAVHVMRRTPAELLLIGDKAALRTVWDVATDRPAVAEELLPPRRVQGGIDVGIGRDVLTFTPEEWPRLAEIEAALRDSVPPVREDTW